MEFGIEKCAMLLMIRVKHKEQKEWNRQIRKESERSEKGKISSTWEY